jgi:hypothetical protein
MRLNEQALGGLVPMPRSLVWSCCAGCGVVDVDGGWPVVAGAGGLAWFLDAVVVVAGSFDGAGAGAVPAGRADLRGDLGQDVWQDVSPALRGERPPSRARADGS